MVCFYLEGEKVLESDPNKILAMVLSAVNDIKFWSTESIYEFLSGTIEQLKIYSYERRIELNEELNDDKTSKKHKKREKARLTRFIKRDIVMPKTRDKLLILYYKLILVNEKKGLLHGFGMKGSLSSPEYSSIYNIQKD